jgi:hypothetical protein
MKRVVQGKLKQFDVVIEDRIGALADVCDLLAQHAINIKALATEGRGTGIVRLVTEDENTTKDVLSKSKIPFKVSDILSLKLMDRPGELAKVAKLLLKAKVNIESMYILGRDGSETDIAVKVDDISAATRALG